MSTRHVPVIALRGDWRVDKVLQQSQQAGTLRILNFAEAAKFLVATSDAEELSIRRALDRHPNVDSRWQGRTFIALGRGMLVVMLAAALAGESAGLDLIERFEGFEVQEQAAANGGQN